MDHICARREALLRTTSGGKSGRAGATGRLKVVTINMSNVDKLTFIFILCTALEGVRVF
jgi:hypothetical protein